MPSAAPGISVYSLVYSMNLTVLVPDGSRIARYLSCGDWFASLAMTSSGFIHVAASVSVSFFPRLTTAPSQGQTTSWLSARHWGTRGAPTLCLLQHYCERGVLASPQKPACHSPGAQLLVTWPLPTLPAPSGLLTVLSYLVQLLGPCGKSCILGCQATRSLGGTLLSILLGQRKGRCEMTPALRVPVKHGG